MFSTQLADYPHPQQGNLSPASPHLLVSVRDADEAILAKSLGVEWIDLKNPDAGSLGAADATVAAAVAHVLNCPNDSRVQVCSAAIGELRDGSLATSRMLATHFPLVKVGLSGLASVPDWPAGFFEVARQVRLLKAQIVPVIYADYRHCDAPAPQAVLEVAVADETTVDPAVSAGYILIDTYIKDGRRLLDWLSEQELTSIVHAARNMNREVVLAGSLALSDLPMLLKLPVAAIAVRGSVCLGNRRSELCPIKVTQWLERVQKP